jgi:dCTP deaminase
MTSGILPDHELERLAAAGVIAADRPFADGQVQPASLDLRLGPVAHRIRASFLPGPDARVEEKLGALTLHTIPIADGAVLETGCVYLVPLQESLALPADIAAAANPKSSTGRLDVFTRVIADHGRAFDTIPAGYRGPLYLEVSPRTFPVLVRSGSRLSQLRLRRGAALLDDTALKALHATDTLAAPGEPVIDGGLVLSVDLTPAAPGAPVGYRAKRHTGVVDVDRIGGYPMGAFWEPIAADPASGLVLDPDEFYILVSREAVHVPPSVAAEMVPIDPLVGEFRVHYAGFFDPGFGHAAAGGHGARAVLEVRSREVPFILEHGQSVGRLVYERLAAAPSRLYGMGIGSNYQAQGLKLSKHFRAA